MWNFIPLICVATTDDKDVESLKQKITSNLMLSDFDNDCLVFNIIITQTTDRHSTGRLGKQGIGWSTSK